MEDLDKSLDPNMAIHSRLPVSYCNLLYSSCSAFMGAVSFGFVIGYSSPALPSMKKEGILDTEQASWFGSLATLGALLGCPLAGWLVERYGRKKALLMCMLPFILGWAEIVFAGSSVSLLYQGRFWTGVASGMVVVIVPLYIAETSTKELRGMLGSGTQLGVTIGILAAYVLGLSHEWQGIATVGLALPIITLLLLIRIPDSPRFLVTMGRRQEALRALSWLRGPHVDVEDECHDIEESYDPNDKMTLSEFSKRELFLPLKVSVGLMIFQQFSGINVVMFYTVSIFEGAGFKENATMATVVIGAVQVVVTVVACLVMDRAGRRVLLMLAGTGMALACFTLGCYYRQQEAAGVAETSDLSWLALSSLVVYIVAFSIGLGPIPMLVMSEIFPVRARGTASGIASFICWFCGFLITKEYATMETMIGQYGTFWFFGLCCILGVIFVWRSVPETKGKSLEDIELYFLGRGTGMRGI